MIELIAVMAIMAIMAVTAVPAIESIGRTRETAAAKTLLHGMTLARQYAVATGVRTWVVFDLNAMTWSVLVEDSNIPGRTNASAMTDAATGRDLIEQLDGGEFRNVQLVSAAFDTGSEIGFDWQGRPLNANETDLAADGQVILTGNHQISVEVETGHIRYAAP